MFPCLCTFNLVSSLGYAISRSLVWIKILKNNNFFSLEVSMIKILSSSIYYQYTQLFKLIVPLIKRETSWFHFTVKRKKNDLQLSKTFSLQYSGIMVNLSSFLYPYENYLKLVATLPVLFELISTKVSSFFIYNFFQSLLIYLSLSHPWSNSLYPFLSIAIFFLAPHKPTA